MRTRLLGLFSHWVFIYSRILSRGILGLNFQSKSLRSLTRLIPEAAIRCWMRRCCLLRDSSCRKRCRNSFCSGVRLSGSLRSRNCFQRSEKLIVVIEGSPGVGNLEERRILRVDRVSRTRAGAKEALEVGDLIDLDLQGTPNGRDQGGLRHPLEELEKLIGDLMGLLALLCGVLDKLIESRVDRTHQAFDPLLLIPRGHGQESFPVDRMLDRLTLCQKTAMAANELVFKEDLQVVGEGPDQAGSAAVGGRDRVAVLIEGDKARFADRGRDLTIGRVRDPRKGLEVLLFQGLGGRLAGTPMETVVSLLPPEAQLSIQIP